VLVRFFATTLLFALACGGLDAGFPPPPQPTSLPPQDVTFESDFRWYAVTGTSVREIDRSLRAAAKQRAGSDGFYARTTWNVRWRYALRGSLVRCQIEGVEVEVDVIVDLPSWKPSSKVSTRLRDQWRRFAHALLEHERGHERNGLDAGREVLQALRTLPAGDSCAEVEERVSETGRAIVQRYRALDRRYDESTQHGRAQGATFPPGSR
jgi:predicted secreted Zn-dependent protease